MGSEVGIQYAMHDKNSMKNLESKDFPFKGVGLPRLSKRSILHRNSMESQEVSGLIARDSTIKDFDINTRHAPSRNDRREF